MLIDLHVHTYRYSGCSVLDPVDLVRRAEDLNLSGIAITEHDQAWSENEIEGLKRQTKTDLLILRGQEVSSQTGHLLVFGYYDNLEHRHVEEVLDKVHKNGGLVILPHPFRYGDFEGSSFDNLKTEFARYDGIEVFNGNQSPDNNNYGEKVWEELGLIGIGGSDAHSINMVGRYLTEFQNEIRNEKDLIEEIEAGRCNPVRLDNVGKAF
jgi:predicted metal-dependent phosphoesterase TrpH